MNLRHVDMQTKDGTQHSSILMRSTKSLSPETRQTFSTKMINLMPVDVKYDLLQ